MLLRKNCLVKTTPRTPMRILFPSPGTILQAAAQVGVEVEAKHHGACDAAIQDPRAQEETPPGLALAVHALRSAPQSANPHFTKALPFPLSKKKKKRATECGALQGADSTCIPREASSYPPSLALGETQSCHFHRNTPG